MTTWALMFLSVGAAYFLGSIPWPYVVVRVLRGIDIRSVGDGNMGTQNVWQAVGPAAALVVLLGDMAKGAAAVLLPGLIGAPVATAALAGPVAVAGHIWPVFLRFRGGGGAATALGVLWALLPREMALLFAVGALALWRSRGDTRVFNLIVLAAVVPLALAFREPLGQWVPAVATAVAVGARHVQLSGLRLRRE